jgi:hypothetical protein
VKKLNILIPVYNDWEAVRLVMSRVITAMRAQNCDHHFYLINDCSLQKAPASLAKEVTKHGSMVTVVNLSRNLGHQRAIAIGLAYIAKNENSKSDVVVMDGDGEDAPEDVVKLVEASSANLGERIIFAERKKRSEGLVFRMGYLIYKTLHFILTGRGIKVGNFSLIPGAQLCKVVTVSELWSHYAAAVVVAKLPVYLVPTQRAKRLAGHPKMNYTALVLHGLAAMSVYAEQIGVRLLFALTIFICLVLAILGVLACLWRGEMQGPNWAILFFCTGLVFCSLVAAGYVLQFVFLVLHGKSSQSFIPTRDYTHFVQSVDK